MTELQLSIDSERIGRDLEQLATFSDAPSPAVTVLSSPSDARMSWGRDGSPASFTQRPKAILKTAIPASAVRLAAGSRTPRRRNVSASAADHEASLISSRSRSSAFATMTAWRLRA